MNRMWFHELEIARWNIKSFIKNSSNDLVPVALLNIKSNCILDFLIIFTTIFLVRYEFLSKISH